MTRTLPAIDGVDDNLDEFPAVVSRPRAGWLVMARTDIAISVPPAALESLRAAAGLCARLGAEYALAAQIIAAGLDARPDAPLQRRNRAIIELSRTFVGEPSEIAEGVSHELRRYGHEDWRGDRNLLAAPAAYQSQPRMLASYQATRAHGGPFTLSSRQIARILKNSTVCNIEEIPGHADALLLNSNSSAQSLIRSKERPVVNAIISDAQFVDAMKRAPAGQAVVQAENARIIAERQKLIDELAALDADATKTFPKLDAAIQTEITATRASEAALKAQNEKLRLAGLAKSGASAAYDAARRQREDKLRATPAAKVLDEFQRSMRDEIDAAMKRHEGGMFHESRPLARDPAERMLRHSYGNLASVKARLNAIHAAMAEAERLRLVADQTDLAARLDALRAALPAIVSAVYPGGAAA